MFTEHDKVQDVSGHAEEDEGREEHAAFQGVEKIDRLCTDNILAVITNWRGGRIDNEAARLSEQPGVFDLT